MDGSRRRVPSARRLASASTSKTSAEFQPTDPTVELSVEWDTVWMRGRRDLMWCADVVRTTRLPGKAPHQRVIGNLGSIRNNSLKKLPARRAFWASAETCLATLGLQSDQLQHLRDKLDAFVPLPPRPRDSQRAALYAAENFIREVRHFPEISNCQRYVDEVLRSRWWKIRYPHIEHVLVRSGRGQSAIATPGPFTIALPRAMRTDRTMLHELCHFATPWRHASHGPEFARIYLQLVRRFIGARSARSLRGAFQIFGVRVQQVDGAGANE